MSPPRPVRSATASRRRYPTSKAAGRAPRPTTSPSSTTGPIWPNHGPRSRSRRRQRGASCPTSSPSRWCSRSSVGRSSSCCGIWSGGCGRGGAPSPNRPRPRERAMRRLACAAALLLAAAGARAHDFWIEPSTFHPALGATVAVGLRVGQDFIGDPVPRASDYIASFSVRQNGADRDIGGTDRIDPAGFLRADASATAVISYASTGAYIELPPDAFEDYLRLYGLDDIVASRAGR